MQAFIDDESGALTVDWAVLTAGVIAMTLLVIGVARLTAEARTDALEADIDVWRNGPKAGAAYEARNRAGFEAMVDAMGLMAVAELRTLAGFVNARTYAGDRTARLQDMRAAVDTAFLAHAGDTRTHEIDYDGAELERIWQDHELDRAVASY